MSEDDTDYLRTIIRIPSGPLLLYLEPCEPYEFDIESSRRDTSVSAGTRSSSDSGMGLSGLGYGKLRGSSISSEISETSSGRSVARYAGMIRHGSICLSFIQQLFSC